MKSTPLDISWDNLFSSIIRFDAVNLPRLKLTMLLDLSSNDLISISCVEYLLFRAINFNFAFSFNNKFSKKSS